MCSKKLTTTEKGNKMRRLTETESKQYSLNDTNSAVMFSVNNPDDTVNIMLGYMYIPAGDYAVLRGDDAESRQRVINGIHDSVSDIPGFDDEAGVDVLLPKVGQTMEQFRDEIEAKVADMNKTIH
jgi:hypothetical protein